MGNTDLSIFCSTLVNTGSQFFLKNGKFLGKHHKQNKVANIMQKTC